MSCMICKHWIRRLAVALRIRQPAALPLLLLLLCFQSGCVTELHSESGKATTVVLIRHAERSMVTGALTSEGHERALALVEALGDARIAAIYSPNLERNVDTVKPLAKHLGVDITLVDEKPDPDAIAGLLLTNHSGRVVLWVGNTTNLADIYYRLGGEGKPPNDYGDLFVLTVPERGATTVDRKRFGR